MRSYLSRGTRKGSKARQAVARAEHEDYGRDLAVGWMVPLWHSCRWVSPESCVTGIGVSQGPHQAATAALLPPRAGCPRLCSVDQAHRPGQASLDIYGAEL